MTAKYRKVSAIAAAIFLYIPFFHAGALCLHVPQPVSLGSEDNKTAELIHDILLSEILKYEVDISDTSYHAVLLSSFKLDEGDRLLISLSAMGPSGDLIYFSTLNRTSTRITLITAVNRMLEELIPSLLASGELPYLESFLTPPPFIDSFQILSPDEGAEVYMGGESAITAVRDGRAKIEGYPLIAGVPVPVEIRKPGYRSQRVYFEKIAEGAELPFPPLEPELRSAWNFSLSTASHFTDGIGAGVGFRFFPYPDWIFIGLEQHLYGEVSGFSSQTGLIAGTYIVLPPELSFRMGLITGLKLLVNFGEEDPLDGVLNFFSLFIEYRLKRITPYLQGELNYLFGESRGYPALTAGILVPGRKRK